MLCKAKTRQRYDTVRSNKHGKTGMVFKQSYLLWHAGMPAHNLSIQYFSAWLRSEADELKALINYHVFWDSLYYPIIMLEMNINM